MSTNEVKNGSEVNSSVKKRGRKAGESAPLVPSTVYASRELAMGQQPDLEKAQLYSFTFERQHEGKVVKHSVHTWALTQIKADSNFLKHFYPKGETKIVSKDEQLKAMKRALAAERAKAGRPSPERSPEPAGV